MIRLAILGEPASKANARQLVTIRGRPAFIKSKKARSYMESAIMQARAQYRGPMMEGELRAYIWIYYASQRPDLDPSVLLDALQGICYANDRQVRELHLYHGIDKTNPRASITIEHRE